MRGFALIFEKTEKNHFVLFSIFFFISIKKYVLKLWIRVSHFKFGKIAKEHETVIHL